MHFFFNIEWLKNKNPVLVSFLEGIGGHCDQQLEIAKAVDACYYLANKQYVAPLSFFQNVLTYFLTGSKTAVKINSAGKLFY